MASKLTEFAIRNAKPRTKKFKTSAGQGLTLLVMPNGSRYWRLRYRFAGKERELSVGRPHSEFLILLLTAMCLASLAVAAPMTMRIDTPGSAFGVSLGKGTVDDVPDGRRVKGEPFAVVTVAGVLKLPPAQMAERRASRLVLHFRTSRGGPRLQKIILPDGSSVEFNLSGDFLADSKRNTLDFGDIPIKLYDRSILKLVIAYPGGIDSQIDPGEFVLKTVSLDYLTKPEVRAAGSTRALPPVALNPNHAKVEASRSLATSHAIFEKPRIDIGAGLTKRLDLCRVWAGECGQPAANAFCAQQGYNRAASFTPDKDIGETAIVSSHRICRDRGCDGFARIECE